MVQTISILQTFLKSASQVLPNGQEGQVGAGGPSHVVPEGPDQLLLSLVAGYEQILSKYIAPEGRCTVQYRVTSDSGITSGDESAQRAR